MGYSPLNMSPDPPVELIANLVAFRQAVLQTEVLKTILTADWFENLREAAESGQTDAVRAADPSNILGDFSLPLELIGCSDEAALMFGGNPLNAKFKLAEQRLAAYSKLGGPRALERLDEIRKKAMAESFHDHLFEALVMGDLALRGATLDLRPVAQNVDGSIDLDGRPILVEVTRTGDDQTTIPQQARRPGGHGYEVTAQVDQIRRKVRKKVAEGKQLALAGDQPGLLVLGLNYYGARAEIALPTLRQMFQEAAYSALSGVVICGPGRFMMSTFFLASQTATVPFSANELRKLTDWYGLTAAEP